MNIIDINLFHEESFVEDRVIKVALDLAKKKMSIELDGGYLTNEKYLTKTEIVVEDWYQLDVVERDGNNKVLDFQIEFFTKIYEFHYYNDTLKLSDVGMNGWIDWIFIKPKVTIYGEIDPNQPPIL